MDDLADLYPPYRLRLRSGDLELRILRDEDFPSVMALKREGIVEPDLPMPFEMPWHEGNDRDSFQFYWSERSKWSPDYWNAMFLARWQGEPCGVQDLHNVNDVRRTKSLATGSWLARRFHRRGIGTQMRQLVAAFAFDQLGALELHSGYIEGNLASERVSDKVGYVANGTRPVPRGDGFVQERRVKLTPDRFVRPAQPASYEGVADFLAFVGMAG